MFTIYSWRGKVFPQAAIFLGLLSIGVVVAFSSGQEAQGFSSSVSINPTWSTSVVADHTYELPSCEDATQYSCENQSNNTLFSLSEAPFFCTDYEVAKIAMQFDLSALPAGAAVTDVQLQVTVSTATFETQTVRRASADVLNTFSCSTSNLYSALSGTGTTTYGTFTNWSTKGKKTLDLGPNAVSDVQARLNGSNTLALSITANGDQYGAIYSQTASADLRPTLIVSYTLPPTQPTDFSHNAISSTSIAWTWIDQAVSDTDNVVHDAAHNVRCSAGAQAGVGGLVNCIEVNLMPNTSYTRHPSAIDPEGSTDGGIDTAFTAIEPPTGVRIDSVTASEISVSATGPASNLNRSQSGLWFEETSSGRSSGWIKATTWTLTDLKPNTRYSFLLQARNGDGVPTSMSPAASVYTLPSEPTASSPRSVATWYTTPEFSFVNSAWGAGSIEYFRYAWDTSPTYAFSGTEPTWGSPSSACPNSACTVSRLELPVSASSDGSWYLHVKSYNAEGAAGPEGTYGPYQFDGTAPSKPIITLQRTSSANPRFSRSLTSLATSWSPVEDATSGLKGYEVAVGTAPGRDDVRAFTSVGLATNAVFNQLTLRDGVTYYLSVRSVDVAGNISDHTAESVFVNTKKPRIVDRQAGDKTHRARGGTRYNVDVLKANTGPNLQSVQYAIYDKPGMQGRRLLDWTNILPSPRPSLTENWVVNFGALREGKNYISVRAVSLDGFVTQKVDAFSIIKDLAPAPKITGVLFSTFPRSSSPITIRILGQGFKPGARVWVGSQSASKVRIVRDDIIDVTISVANLKDGGHNLRVVNPNGRQAIRRNKIIILP